MKQHPTGARAIIAQWCLPVVLLLAACGEPAITSRAGGGVAVDTTPTTAVQSSGAALTSVVTTTATNGQDGNEVVPVPTASELPEFCQEMAGEALETQMRRAQTKLRNQLGKGALRLAVPSEVAGFKAADVQTSTNTAPVFVQTCLIDRKDPTRWVVYTQAEGGLGGAMVSGIEYENAQVQGVEGQLGRGKDRYPGELVEITWTKGGISYGVSGHNVPEETVVRIANSVTPLK